MSISSSLIDFHSSKSIKFKNIKHHKLNGVKDMSGTVAQKRGDQLQHDMEVVYYVVKKANDEHSQITESSLQGGCTFLNAKGKWGFDKLRFNAAFDALIKGGYVRETSEKVKTGMFKSEHALEAVKLPGKVEEPSMRKDIEGLRKGRYPYSGGAGVEL